MCPVSAASAPTPSTTGSRPAPCPPAADPATASPSPGHPRSRPAAEHESPAQATSTDRNPNPSPPERQYETTVPNTADRVAQPAAAMLLEATLEPIFHRDSDGYRPGRSAHDALAVARRRCWRQDWVLDIDVRAFFDSVPHDLL